jgi:hypothetical protein
MLQFATNVLSLFGALPGSCKGFFGIPTWYEYLDVNNKCQVASFQVPGDILLVALAIVDILLHVAGLVAVGFVMYGGVRYSTSQGNPDEAAKAQSTVFNALIGLLLTVVAIALVSFLGKNIG